MIIYESLKERIKGITSPIKNLFYSFIEFFYKINVFYSKNPLTNQDKSNFTKSLDDYLTSKFNVSYNSKGMVFTKKIDNSKLINLIDS
jgi:hypothetical protein